MQYEIHQKQWHILLLQYRKKTNETADSSPHNLEGYVRRN